MSIRTVLALSAAVLALGCGEDADDDRTPWGGSASNASATTESSSDPNSDDDDDESDGGDESTGDDATGGPASSGGAASSGTADASGGATDAATGPAVTTGSDASTDGGTGAPAADWANFAEGFFATFCSSCHSPAGQASADFALYSVVAMRLNAIKCGVAPTLLDGCEGEHAPGWFPIGDGPRPTEDERWTLVDWIEAGAPE